jgi:hypothetical protein
MVITVEEYAKRFPSKGKILSSKTIARRCADGLLPSNHHARQLPNESGSKGQWVIEIPDRLPEKEIVATKLNPVKPDLRTLNRKFYSW